MPIGGAPARIALEQLGSADVGAHVDGARRAQRVGDDLRERRDVAQREIEPLPRHGVQAQRRIADQHGARAVNRAARDARERVEMALADAREAAETLAERRLQLGAKRVDGQRRHPRRVAFGQRPDHGRAAARERQERNRARAAVKRSNARPSSGASVLQLNTTARWP